MPFCTLNSPPPSSHNFVHNLSFTHFSQEEINIFKYGYNFIPTPKPLKKEVVLSSFDQFARNMRVQLFFNNPSTVEKKVQSQKKEKILKFHVKNPLWKPSMIPSYRPDPTLELYLYNTRKEIESNFNNFASRFRSNLSPLEKKAIEKLKSHTSLYYTNTDKGCGPAAVELEKWYIPQALKHLENKENYEEISLDFLENMEKVYNQSIKSDLEKLNIPDYIVQYIVQFNENNFVTPKFYLLPKVHKLSQEILNQDTEKILQNLTGRPIVACHSYLTTNLSKFVSYLLQHSVSQYPSILKNTITLVNELENLDLNNISDLDNIYIVTADVENLYPNVPVSPDDIRECIEETFIKHPLFENISTKEIVYLINKVLYHAPVQFYERFWRQINGLSMGTPLAPTYANLFLYFLEKSLVQENSDFIILFRRFLDDLFFLFKGNVEKLLEIIDRFNNLHPKIKLTFKYSKIQQQFMDIVVYKDNDFSVTRRFKVKVFQKDVNKFLYIHRNSFHSKHIFKGFIKGELIRYIRFSSKFEDFCEIRRKFFKRLLLRGYKPQFLLPLFNSVDFNNRKNLLEIKAKEDSKIPPIFSTFDNPVSRQLNITKTLHKHWEYIELDSELNQVFTKKPITSYKINKPLINLLKSLKK